MNINNNLEEVLETALPSRASYDTLTSDNLDALIERIKEDMRRKEILNKHKPAIKQLPSGRYYTRIDGKKIEKTSKKDVEDIVVKYYSKVDITLEEIFDDYLKRRKLEVSSRTWSKDIRFFNNYIKPSHISTKPIARLDLDDGYEFLNECMRFKSNLKRKYWNNIYGCLNQMFQYAIDKRIIDDNPFKNMRPKKDLFAEPTITRDGDTVFTKAEQAMVCQLAEEESANTNSAIPLGIILLFNLGIRDGELCAIKWGDIETGVRGTYIHIQREMVVNINDKGMSEGFTVLPHCKTPAGDRRLQLNSQATTLFKRIKALNDSEGFPTELNDYVFLRFVKGEITTSTPRCFDHRLRKYCRQADMDVIKSPHDIRRTVLTNLYTAGMPLKKIQEFAGHSSLKQTMDYIRISDEDIDLSEYLNTLSDTTITNVVPFKKEA